MTRPESTLPWERYVQVIDQVKPYACLVLFWSWGEPFLNPDAFRMIRYAKAQGLVVHSSTNGHYFVRPDDARQVVESGLDSLIFAVDGLDAETYAAYRRGGDLETVLESIRQVLQARTSAGVDHPFVTFRFMPMEHNKHQVGDVEAFARNLGVDAVTWRKPVPCRGAASLDGSAVPSGRASSASRRFQCHRPLANLTVFSGGEVVLCEEDYNAEVTLGSVNEASINAILASPRATEALRLFAREGGTSFCRDCEFRCRGSSSLNTETRVFPAGHSVAGGTPGRRP